MWNSLQSPNSDDLESTLEPSPSGETPASQLRGMLGQESEESDDEDADYIPSGLANFVKQAEATLNSTRETFLNTAAKSPTREPAVFCFDGSGRSSTPPLEDEEDVDLRNEVLDRFKSKCGDEMFDVDQILSSYTDNTPNEAEEVLFSPDLKTPPANPHYNISSAQARKLALGTPALTVDTDILPIRPPAHEDSGSSNSVDEEPDEPMDPISWLDSALCDRSTEHGSAEKKSDPPSQPTPQKLEPTPHLQGHKASPFAEVATPVAVPTQQIRHVGEVDETKSDPPPSTPKPVVSPTVEVPRAPLEGGMERQAQKTLAEKVPIEVAALAQTEPDILPTKVTVPVQTKAGTGRTEPIEVTIEKALGGGKPDKTRTETSAKRTVAVSAGSTTSSKKTGHYSVSDRLFRPTTTSATKAAAANRMTPGSTAKTLTPSHRSPLLRSPPAGTSAGSASAGRSVPSAQRANPPTPQTRTTPASLRNDRKTPVRKAPPSSSGRTQPVSGSKVARTPGNPSPRSSALTSTGGSPTETPGHMTGRVTRTFKQSQPLAPLSSAQKTAPVLTTNRQSSTPGVSSRLLQETTSSRLRHAAVATGNHAQSSSPTQPSRDAPGTHISSRLLQETTVSKYRHTRVEVSTPKSPSRHYLDAMVPGRLLQDTTASRQRRAAMEDELRPHEAPSRSPSKVATIPAVASRLLQETTTWKLHHEVQEEAHAQTPQAHSELAVSSRLLQPTSASLQKVAAKAGPHFTPPKPIASDEAKLQASRERARERVRQHMARERQRETSFVSSKHNAASPEEGVARARERVRLRQEKERQERMAREKENIGGKMTAQSARRPTLVDAKEQKRRPLTIPQGPRLSTARRQTARPELTGSVNLINANARHGPAAVVEMTLAQSTEILRKGLRGDDMSHYSNTSGRRELTIAHAPRFATSARHGEKLSSVGWKETATLASSTRRLQHQLRGEDPCLMKKRELKLTVPETPKFHETSKRVLPKSTAEREEEMMKKFNARPFKARPYRPSAPETVAPARKSVPRPSTTPRPFHLASDKRAAAAPPKPDITRESEDDVELKKQFHARPMPSFANPPRIKKAPRSDPHPNGTYPDRSMSPPKLRTSDRAGKRLETAQTFSTHAEQVVRQRELEQKRRQREKHEEEIRRAQAQRNADVVSVASRTSETFQLASQVRHEEYQKRMEERLRQQLEEEKKAAAFQARQFRPAPAPEQKREKPPPTTPEPFALMSEKRHSDYEERNRRKVEEAEQEVQQKALFRARPVPQTTYQATSPANSPPFLLATTARLRDSQEKKKLREEAELEELRKQAQFKARPVPVSTYTYRPISPSRRSPGRARDGNGTDANPIRLDEPPAVVFF